MHLRPRHPHLPAWFLLNPSYPLLHNLLHNPPSPVEAIPADRENTVVRFQHVVACPDHNGFRQLRSNEAVYLITDLVYFLFVHRHSPSQFCAKKYQPSYLTVGVCLFIFYYFCPFLKIFYYHANNLYNIVSTFETTKD